MVLSKADTVLKEIERMREEEFLPIIGPHRGQVLVDVIREIKPKRVLEVGTLIGYSAVLMGKELGSDAHLITIDIRAEAAKMAEENIKKAEIPPTVEVLMGDAKEVIPTLEGAFDLVFIDANKREYLDYLLLVEDKLHKGSVIVADNAGIFAEKMKDYLDYVRSSRKYSSKFMPAGEDGLEVSIKL
ncbi:MAG: O-methyltransferase [Candidatus Hodarchaeota archaeon]